MSPQSPNEKILVRLLTDKFDEMVLLVNQLPDGLLNDKLPIAGSNSPVQILVHCCGMMRRWSSTVNLGIQVDRDRKAEFSAVLTKAEALAVAESARKEFLGDVARTEMQEPPAQIPEGRDGEHWMATCQGVLFHVFEEFCQHLGQLEITRDILVVARN